MDHKDVDQEDDNPFDEYKTAEAHTTCSTYHQTHGHLLAQLVYGQDWLGENEYKKTRLMNKKTQNELTTTTAKEIGLQWYDWEYQKEHWLTVVEDHTK